MANNTYEGAVLTGISTGTVLAHELGHQLGFRDIYSDASPDSTGSVPDDFVTKAWMSADWTGDPALSYYRHELRHWETLRRLLMHGKKSAGIQRDIPLGNIHGVWYEFNTNTWAREYKISDAPVGRSNIKETQYDHR